MQNLEKFMQITYLIKTKKHNTMGLFSLNWFKSQKEKQLEELQHQIELRRLEKTLERMDDQEKPSTYTIGITNPWVPTAPVCVPAPKPYSNIKMVNDVLTVVLNDGSIITKSNANAEDFTKARECRTEACLLTLVGSPEIQKEKKEAEAAYEKAKNIQRGAEYLSKFKDFEMKHGSLYLKGINRSIPPLMVEKFLEILGEYSYNGEASIEEIDYMVQEDEEYQGLKRFFMWCCLNPRAEVADKLYNFLVNNSFRITKQGFFVALRNVVTLHGSNELVHFVSNAYNKVKAVWKKKPDDYIVFLKHGEYVMVHKSIFEELEPCTFCDENGNVPSEDEDGYDYSCECPECYGSGTVYKYCEEQYGEKIGNLTELYLDLPNRADNRFTDAHTRTFDIRIGRAVSMDPGKCRWNTDDCGAEGLHFTSDEINYVGCGDTSVIVLINPMKVVGIGQSKGRCWEYLPIMTVPTEEVTEILHDLEFDTLELDESYAIRELENLAEKAKEGFTAEATKYDFNLPALSTVEVLSIVKSLDEIKQEISKRIVNID
jgi:hypothetical protein